MASTTYKGALIPSALVMWEFWLPEGVSGMGLLISSAALAGAYARTVETSREDRLIDDPWAAGFLRAAGRTPPQHRGGPAVGTTTPGPNQRVRTKRWVVTALEYLIIRTHFFDQLILHATTHGHTHIVLLGAGLDTRALRLPLPAHTRVYEVDTSATLEFTHTVITATRHPPRSTCHRVPVPADPPTHWPRALRAAGFNPHQPTLWIAETLPIRLPITIPAVPRPRHPDGLLHRINALSVTGARLGAVLTPPTAQPAQRPDTTHPPATSDQFTDPIDWLATHRWHAQVTDAASYADLHHRLTPSRTAPIPDTPHWLTDATRTP
jgi:methyltransferase (TIGR00027 family)